MEQAFAGVASALWLGIMTSLTPCPLATNIAAISFISKRITHPVLVLCAGIGYTLGRMSAYAVLGFLLITSLLAVPQSARFLQKYGAYALGPVLIATGLVLLEAFKLRLPDLALSHKHRLTLAEAGVPGAFLLGLVFALAFCPVSAALFFGSLIPLALNHPAGTMLPFVYGVGTGLPVIVFAVVIAFGITSLSRWFNRLAGLELCMRRITGVVFILIGLYYIGITVLKTGGAG